MNKTTGIILLIILIIVGGFILYGKGSKSTTYNNVITENPTEAPVTDDSAQPAGNPPAPTSNAPTVTYTDSGFSPAVLSITVGTTVTFVNQSSGMMWVASNPHPIHTDLSGFDEKMAVPNGGTYSYTFVKIGQFGFHNHVNPSKVGVITVR